MPNLSGIWNLKEQLQAAGLKKWSNTRFTLYSWGLDDNGQLGRNSNISKSSPVQVRAFENWSQVSVGTNHTMAINDKAELYSWGLAGNVGRLGESGFISRSSPVQIGSFADWIQVSSGYTSTLAITAENKLYGWGENGSGNLGLNNYFNQSFPVQVGALTNWKQVSSGQIHSGAVKTDGTLWCWGNNSYGQVGINNTTFTSSPIQVGALTNWSQLSLGTRHSAAVKTDGTLWTWGRNGTQFFSVGVLGQNNLINRSSPVQVGALTNWVQVSSPHFGNTCLAITTNGELYAWGTNGSGELGDGTTIARSSPVQIGALTNWAQVSAGQSGCIALKTDGTIWTWGYNGQGQLGQNDVIRRSSPVQVGALSNWVQVSNSRGMAAILQY